VLTRRLLAAAAAGILATGCSLDKQTVPGLSGPSELGVTLTVTATPDTILQDGKSQSVVEITARDANGQPVRGLSMRADMAVNGTPQDFGTLSTKAPSTGNDGRAQITYLSPAAPPPNAEGGENFIDINVTTVGTNAGNAQAHAVRIRLVKPGVILPPNGAPVPVFFFSPSSPRQFEDVTFDASASTDDGVIVSYTWNFGDGDTAGGKVVKHDYALPGTYGVTLTVTDDRGNTAMSAPKDVSVGTSANPTASFTFSPTAPTPGTQVNFNASASQATPGRHISDYEFDFGDGSPHGHGVTVAHVYTLAGDYNVVLTVTDDGGRTATNVQKVTVANAAPTATFTYSPTPVVHGVPVTFNASASTAPIGRTIVSYAWDFGSAGATASGVTTTYAFPVAGTYTVTLTVTDNTGAKAVFTLALSAS